jgi:hypothetical protein
MVEWDFLFKVMSIMGFPCEFTNMVKLLFQDAAACMKVNGSLSESFLIGRGMRQGCPIAPYLFLIAAEVLNTMVAKELEEG